MSATTAWIVLIVAGFFEVCWAVGLKFSSGFSKLGPSVFTLVTLAISMYLLARATAVLDIGVAYSVWVGIGALGASVLGILLFKEPVSFSKLVFMAMLLVSIAGLKLTAR